MTTSGNGRKSMPFGKRKSDVRSLKRKREVDEHQVLNKNVEELVSLLAIP